MQSVDDLPDMLTVQQAADFLQVSKNTMYTWCNTGELPSFKAGNTRRIRKAQLLGWLEKPDQERS